MKISTIQFYGATITNFPFRNGNEIKVHLIDSITHLLNYLKVKTLISLKTILIVLLKEIYVDDSRVIQPNLSEELKLSIISCLEITTRCISSDIIEQFYVVENRIIIARILLVCVQLINTEKNRPLRWVILHCKLNQSGARIIIHYCKMFV